MLPRGQNADHYLRKRQIDTLKIFNHNVHEIKENESYVLGFMSNQRPIQIVVDLPSDFPNEKPKLMVVPTLRHAWVNQDSGEVQSPGLLNYTVHSDLGRVVQAVIREFEKHPPPLAHESDPSVLSPHKGNDAPVGPTFSIPELATLRFDQLEELNADPQYLDDFVEEMAAVKSLNRDLCGLLTDIEALANQNLEKREKITSLVGNIDRLSTDFKAMGEKYEALNTRHQKKAEEFAPQHIKELLQIAASTADSLAEQHTDDFMAKKIDVDAFLCEYMNAKKVSVLRKTKEERLNETGSSF